MEILKGKQNFNFMSYRKITGMVSISLVILSVVMLLTRSLNFGIDFTGGTLIELEYKEAIDIEVIRKKLSSSGYQKFQVKYYGSNKDIHIYIPPADVSGDAKTDKKQSKFSSTEHSDRGLVIAKLLKETSKEPIDLRRSDFVGAQVGEELTEDGGLALLTALICILFYVAFRFEYRFAIGAVTALVHDVCLILGFFAMTQIEFDLSVLAALLAVIGYSLNDTIVVFDRIRENFRKMRKSSSFEIMNTSINETLSRTIITSVTTLLVLLALFFIGGSAIRGFSIALILGVVIGTYSSIFVASNAALQLGVSRSDLLEVKKEGADFDDGMP